MPRNGTQPGQYGSQSPRPALVTRHLHAGIIIWGWWHLAPSASSLQCDPCYAEKGPGHDRRAGRADLSSTKFA